MRTLPRKTIAHSESYRLASKGERAISSRTTDTDGTNAASAKKMRGQRPSGVKKGAQIAAIRYPASADFSRS